MKINYLLKTIINISYLNKYIIIGYLAIVTLIPNLKYIIYEDKYLIRSFIYVPLIYGAILFIVLSY